MPRTILILSSNPIDTSRLRLDTEIREIDLGLRRAKKRDEFIINQVLAARASDVRRAMLDFNPNIVHFCGHGGGEEGIAFEDEDGKINLVKANVLADFFKLFSDKVECIVLNACYSELQAEAIGNHIDYVIGMRKAIGDYAAIEFAVAFYDALGAGKSYEFAFELACNAINWKIQEENLTPTLKIKKNNKIQNELSLDGLNDTGSLTEELPISWIMNYMRSLETLAIDLRLIVKEKFEIFISIDFGDIFEYCYPFINASQIEFRGEYVFEPLLERQLSRYMLFYKFMNFYSFPLLLLPPYLAESYDTLKFFNTEFRKYTDKLNRDYVMSIFEKYKNKHEDSNGFLDFINETSPELAFILGPSFREGFSIYRELMKDIIKPETKRIDGYLDKILYISDMENSLFDDIVKAMRPYPQKRLQNRRDAKAIQYVTELNKKIVNDNKLLILISSTPYIRKLIKLFDNKLYIDTHEERVYLLRDTGFLYTALIELGGSLESKTGKIDLRNVEAKDLLKIVESNLDVVKKFYDAYEAANALGLSGRIKDNYINDFIDLDAFKRLIESRKKLNVMALINDFLVEGSGIEHLKKLDFRNRNLRALDEIEDIIKSQKFSEYIDLRRNEIQKEMEDLERILEKWYR